MKGLGMIADKDQLKKLIEQYDHDDDGTIDLMEFMTIIAHKKNGGKLNESLRFDKNFFDDILDY